MAVLALTLVRSAQLLLLWLFLSDVSHSSYGAKMSQNFKMPIPSTNICLNDYVFKEKFKSVYINFIHVFKTGGSSLRHLMRDYSRLCEYSIGILIKCDMNASSANMKKLPCRLKDAHSGFEALTTDKSTDRLPLESYAQFNLMAGHFNLKIYNSVKQFHGNSKEIVFTWMRDPFAMLISSSTFLINKSAQKTSLEDIVKKMFSKLRNQRRLHADGVYSQFTNYYSELDSTHNSNLKPDALIQSIKANIDKFTMIGMIENHVTSIKMLQAVLDPRGTLKASFWKDALSYERNKSELVDEKTGKEITKGDIMAYIKSNPSNFTYIMDRLESEYQLYQHGLKLHNKQCADLRASFPSILDDVNCNILNRSEPRLKI